MSRDPQVDEVLLKSVILKPYKGVIMDFSLSYGVEWPMTLAMSNTVHSSEQAGAQLILTFYPFVGVS